MPYLKKEDKQKNGKEYRMKNIKRIKENHRKDYIKNRERYILYNKEYAKKRMLENPEHVRKLARARLARYHKTPKGIYKLLKYRSQKNKRSILSQDEFIKWYNKQDKICFYCHIPESLVGYIKNKNGRNRLSIERLDWNKGYEKNNMCLACFTCNCVKNTVFDSVTMKKLAIKFIKPLWHSNIKH